MLTSKQRSNLRSLANGIKPVTQVGKNGVNDTLIACISDALEAHELVKITVLENSMLTPKDVGFEIGEKTGAEFVCATGRKLVFYRRSKKDGIKHIEY